MGKNIVDVNILPKMATSTPNKVLSVFSLASIAMTFSMNPANADYPAFADDKFNGSKGTYTISYTKGTYHGCLYGGGCITLGRKYLVPCKSQEADACEVITWRKGVYEYLVHDRNIYVLKNGVKIFEDTGRN